MQSSCSDISGKCIWQSSMLFSGNIEEANLASQFLFFLGNLKEKDIKKETFVTFLPLCPFSTTGVSFTLMNLHRYIFRSAENFCMAVYVSIQTGSGQLIHTRDYHIHTYMSGATHTYLSTDTSFWSCP